MKSMIKNRSMINHSIFSRGIKYDYMNILTWTILKKTQLLNGCETFAFKYIWPIHGYLMNMYENKQLLYIIQLSIYDIKILK